MEKNSASLTPLQWAALPLKKFAHFSGRAPRAEYWWFYLATLIAQIPISLLDEWLGTSDQFSSLYSLMIFTPWIAATVRRLHDTGRAGWWLLLPLITLTSLLVALFLGFNFGDTERLPLPVIVTGILFVGASITIFVFLVLPGAVGANRYGPDPYGPDSLAEVFT